MDRYVLDWSSRGIVDLECLENVNNTHAKKLILSNNKLRKIAISSIPPSVIHIDADHNLLTYLDGGIGDRREHFVSPLEIVNFSCNKIVAIGGTLASGFHF